MAVQLITTATSGTVTCANTGQDVELIHDAGATLTLTIEFPANPVNGQRVLMASSGGITTLTLTAVVGAIISAITSLAVGTPATYMYVSSISKWIKI